MTVIFQSERFTGIRPEAISANQTFDHAAGVDPID